MIYVVSRDKLEYEDWLDSCYSDKYMYVESAGMIASLHEIEGIFIGTCYDRKDIVAIVSVINAIRYYNMKPEIDVTSLRHLTRGLK